MSPCFVSRFFYVRLLFSPLFLFLSTLSLIFFPCFSVVCLFFSPSLYRFIFSPLLSLILSFFRVSFSLSFSISSSLSLYPFPDLFPCFIRFVLSPSLYYFFISPSLLSFSLSPFLFHLSHFLPHSYPSRATLSSLLFMSISSTIYTYIRLHVPCITIGCTNIHKRY